MASTKTEHLFRKPKLEEAEYVPEGEEVISGQQAKGIELDDEEYAPGYGITEDWALSFYREVGGEG